jgi:hypothetical protein
MLLPVFVLAACSNPPTYTVAGNPLTVHDSGYYTAPYFCEGAGQGQIRIDLVDYKPICGLGASSDGFSDPQDEHNDLELIVVYDITKKPTDPYMVSAPNCTLGPAGPGIGYFNHYPSGSNAATQSVAQSGNIFVTSYDASGKKPITGSFTLDFGSDGTINGDFSSYTCE